MRRLIAALLLGCATALASAEQPWVEEIPAAALDADTVRFVQANAEFALLHEMGHLLIHELGLPVLGREEDAADQLGFMGLFLLYRRQHEPDFAARLLDIADYWRLEWQRAKPPHEEVREWDSHALDAQRFYNLACLAYGSDPRQLEWIIQATGLPEQRAFYCDQEYQQVLHAVSWLKRHYQRQPGQPAGAQISVVYDEPSPALADGAELLAKVRGSGELEAVAAKAGEAFVLPRPLLLRLTSCGEPDAWYNQQSGELTLCYERLVHLRQLAAQLPRLRQPLHPAKDDP